MFFSEKAKNMEFSAVRKLIPYSTEAEKNGIKVYKLSIGQPDIETPKVFYDGIDEAKEKVLKYANSQGEDLLVENFIEAYKRNGHLLNKDEVYVTQGGSEALVFAILAICNEGDEILVPEPYYSNYKSFVCLAGVNIIPIETDIENNFALPAKEKIAKLITKKTRAILFSNPANPTGKVYSREEIKMLGEVALENDLFIISDEVYKEFIYNEQKKHESILSFKELENNFILIESVSKHYSACGARIGFLISKNKELMTYILKFCQSRLCSATLEQYGAAKLLKISKEYFSEIKDIYMKRRNILIDTLKEIEDITFSIPDGALYIFAKLPIDSSENFCKWLLKDFRYENSTVMLAPGEGFYSNKEKGKKEVRISFCISDEDLKKAVVILKNAIAEYNKLS